MKGMRLRDFPSFVRATDPNDIMLNYLHRESQRTSKGSHVILNTYDALKIDVLQAMNSFLPPIHTIGPLRLLVREMDDGRLDSLESNLWKEDPECIKWLDSKEPNLVVLVNFGSITVMSTEQMIDFAWGGEQQAPFHVLGHFYVAEFLTHRGWNSIIDAICAGVPLICWPFFAEQQTNCWYCCNGWDIGMEIDNNVKRDKVESLVRELMEGDKGKEMKRNAEEWKKKATEATRYGGSSFVNFERLVNEVILQK
ncbi:hypothetical protein Scep_027873 [Stephania cephalantha]|uniref:Uncharacterized protein n=1 Tax=Stephania cephalantha TaxID=152367 RepID=A0AAP0E8U7_9MAGN